MHIVTGGAGSAQQLSRPATSADRSHRGGRRPAPEREAPHLNLCRSTIRRVRRPRIDHELAHSTSTRCCTGRLSNHRVQRRYMMETTSNPRRPFRFAAAVSFLYSSSAATYGDCTAVSAEPPAPWPLTSTLLQVAFDKWVRGVCRRRLPVIGLRYSPSTSQENHKGRCLVVVSCSSKPRAART